MRLANERKLFLVHACHEAANRVAAWGEKGKKEDHLDYGFNVAAAVNGSKLTVMKSPTDREIKVCYELGHELGCGEFGITFLCTDKETGEELACT